MKRRKWGFITVIVVAIVALALAMPREDLWLSKLGVKDPLKVRLGLDLQGGTQLVYKADLSKANQAKKAESMQALVKIIAQRVTPSGTSEANVQTSGSDRILIECPGKDVCDSKTIGKTAELIIVRSSSPTLEDAQPTGLTGSDIQSIDVDIDTATGRPVGKLQMKSGEATKKFGDLTTAISKTGGYLTILVDNVPAFGPATASPITDGQAQLQGNFQSMQEAYQVRDLIRGGALPVPIELVQEQTIGATLGQESIAKSIVAGIIGLTVVALFMILYYRFAGVIAVVALGIYTLLTLALYKLSGITPSPIVLTLAGIAGFVLSIGMAVDANILIFERTKEEYRGGKEFVSAVESGFDRAWSSIRDSNVSTLITCAILFVFAGSVPIIKGFAVTLALGVLVSMFTAITVSRTLLRMVMRTKWGTNPKLYGFKAHEGAAK